MTDLHARRGDIKKMLETADTDGWHPETTLAAVMGKEPAKRAETMLAAVRAGCPWHPATTYYAVQHETLVPLRSGDRPIADRTQALLQAAGDDRPIADRTLPVVLAAMRAGCPWHPCTTSAAAERGLTDLLVALQSEPNFGEWDPYTTYAAAKNGHTAAILTVRQLGCPWAPNTTSAAAIAGDIEVLRAVLRGPDAASWDPATSYWAASCGHTDPEWYTHPAASWHPGTTGAAAKLGHTEVMLTVRRLGCPWDPRTTYWAAWFGHLETLQAALEAGCPLHPRTRKVATAEAAAFLDGR